MRIVRRSRKTPADLQSVTAFVERRGGIAYAREKMLTLADEAAAILEPLPPSGARDALLDLVAYTVSRSK
jgi:octaprenyl-diphosphate synthase